jgi:transposase-like protein
MHPALDEKYLHDEAAAYRWVEDRVWPEGPICPHCGGFDRISKMKGKSTRLGAYKCYQCRKPFTVKVGTIFESSHVPLRHWLQAIFFMASSKKGISANQLARTLGCTLKTGWFIGHRIREAMKVVGVEPVGGAGKVVEMDETYFGDKHIVTKRTKRTKRGKSGHGSKRSIVALVERGGSARMFHVDVASKMHVENIVRENVKRASEMHTDESKLYGDMPDYVAEHHTVIHSGEEYVRYEGERTVHTNTVEGALSVFKRGMKGTY